MPPSADLLRELEGIRENAWALGTLAKQVRSAVGIIPFVGAGLSKPLGFPLWTEFLLEQAALAGLRSQIEGRIGRGEYEEAAEELEKARGPRRFEDAIARCFGQERLGASTPGAVSLLPRLAGGPVITTNFDPVLEAVFEQAQRPFATKVCGARVATAVAALNQSDRLLLKLHGDHAEPLDRVLTVSQYAAAYGSLEPAQVDLKRPLPRLLRLILQSRPLLFLGCSLNQDRTLRVLARVTEDYPELAHYAVVELPASDDEIVRRDKFLSDHSIRPIWYPPGRHEAVALVLERLMSPAPAQPANKPAADPLAAELRAQLQAAGYTGADLSSLSAASELGHSDHSALHRGTLDGQPVVIKKTRRDICNLAALRQVQGKIIAVPSGGLSTEIGTPQWVGASTDQVFEIQRLYPGIRLDEMVHRGPFRVRGDLLEDIYESLIWSVHRLHEEVGLLHRDVCPANILVHGDGDRVRLTLIDCAFSWPLDEPGQIPVRNDSYTAPEQVAGKAGPSSDWYSVASTCYFLATGIPPDPKDEDAFEAGLEKLGSGFIAHIVRSLLRADPDARPKEFWQLLPRPTSERVYLQPQLVGALDLGASGAVLVYRSGYAFVPRSAVNTALAEHRAAGRITDANLQRFLEQLASRPA